MAGDDLLAVIAAIEAAGFDWAVGRLENEYSAAVEKRPASYIGDGIHMTGCEGGDTPQAALMAAFRKACDA